ncbi:hypothetical protein BaRGS_00003954, partial [Batillaria attramentaria]
MPPECLRIQRNAPHYSTRIHGEQNGKAIRQELGASEITSVGQLKRKNTGEKQDPGCEWKKGEA